MSCGGLLLLLISCHLVKAKSPEEVKCFSSFRQHQSITFQENMPANTYSYCSSLPASLPPILPHHLIFMQPCALNVFLIPILQRTKLRNGKIRHFAQDA